MNASTLRGFAVFAFACGSFVRAQIVPISSHAFVSASGSATTPAVYGGQNDSYSLTDSSTNFQSYSGSVSGSAFAELTNISPSSVFLGTTLSADSQATQITSIAADAITLNSTASAHGGTYSQIGSRAASARSFTEITFRVDDYSTFSLAGSGSHYREFESSSVFFTSLTSTSGSEVFRLEHQLRFPPPFGGSLYWFDLGGTTALTGTLAPGTYTFKTDINAYAPPDPLGGADSAGVSLALRVTVPDAGHSLVLLMMALAGLVVVHRRTGGNAQTR